MTRTPLLPIELLYAVIVTDPQVVPQTYVLFHTMSGAEAFVRRIQALPVRSRHATALRVAEELSMPIVTITEWPVV
jgi:hypothetical protein